MIYEWGLKMGQTGLTPCFYFELLIFTLIFSTCMSDGVKDHLFHK